ncbi:MAG: methyltransferase [Dehalogenimonas sp.]|jgi:protein-S-isoprenylcysteine O-methyltransferase Ste14|uniref:Methyltransferase n=1 Tax=Candidatus Dehalogenimonas loeffleri TaxID=3127115 RepID=A0ABZ2J492_9CHLR|nr:methyltransferase [Dehalogenimonas sp.]
MNYILLGAAGFMLMHFLDFASMKKITGLKPLLWLVGTGLVVYAMFNVAVTGNHFGFPVWINIFGWGVFSAALFGMAYSLYVALPIGKTYISSGTSGQLVTNGIYELVRHPWLLFFGFAMAGLVLLSGSLLALWAGIVWVLFSTILVYLQDRYVFPRMFPGYHRYQETTPMLIPSKQSLTAFFKGLKKNNKLEVQSK